MSAAPSAPRPTLPAVIETARLRLRPYRLDDVEQVLLVSMDAEWARFLPVPIPYRRKDAEEFVARQVLLDRVATPSWAIELDGSYAGGINLRFNFDHRLAELGYATAPRWWGQGVAPEAARAVIDTAFRTHADLNRVRATADLRNRASQRVMEKLGMRREGVLRQNRYAREEFVDEAWYGLLRSEWSG